MHLESYPFIAVAAIFCFYLAGTLIGKAADYLFSSDFSNNSVFIRLFLGVYTIVPVYAVIKNKANTSLLGLLIGMLIFLYLSKKGNNSYQILPTDKKYYLSALILVLFSVLWECIFFLKANGNYRLPHYDVSYYGYISQYVGINLTENAWGYLNLLPEISPQPFALYHYFEFWTTNIFTQFGLNAAATHLLITQPIFYSLILLGLADLLSIRNPIYIILIAFATSGFIILNISSDAVVPVLDLKSNLIRSPFSSFTRKIAPVLPVIILSFIYLKEKKTELAILISGLAACINVIYIPFVAGGWGIYLLIKRYPVKSLIYHGALLSVPLGILTVQFILNTLLSERESIIYEKESAFTVMAGIKYIIGHFRLVIIYIPVTVLLFIYRKDALQNSKDILLITTAGVLSGIGLGFLLAGNHNSAQLSYVAGLSVISVALAYLLGTLVSQNKKSIVFIAVIFLGVVALFNNFIINLNQYKSNPNYSEEFIRSFQYHTQGQNTLGFYLKEDDKYKGPYGKQVNVDFKGFPLLYTQKNVYTISLDPIFSDISELKSYEMTYLVNSPLHKRKLLNPEKSDSVLIEETLRDYHISWGLVSEKKELPQWITQRAYTEIIDSNTGDKLIIFENQTFQK